MESLIQAAALAVAFGILVSIRDRTKWLLFDSVFACGFGLIYFLVPSLVMSQFVTAELDNGAISLTQLYGVAMAGTGLLWLITRGTHDGTVPVTIMTARIFSCSLGLLTQVYTYWGTMKGKKNIDWTTQMVSFGMCGYLMWIIGHLFYLIRSQDFCSYPQYNVGINLHLRIDAAFSLILAIVFLAFPDLVLQHMAIGTKSLNCVHLHLVRNVGVMVFTSVVMAMYAPGFLHEHDKRTHFVVRIISHFLLYVPLVVMVLWHNTMATDTFARLFAVTSPIVINAICGMFASGTAKIRMD